MPIPPPTTSKGYWDINGCHGPSIKHPPHGGAVYVLSDNPDIEGQVVMMELQFPNRRSPFTYKDSVWLEPMPKTGEGSRFAIEGEGIVVPGTEYKTRESKFKIVVGSGEGLYSGIEGSGKLIVISVATPGIVRGSCVFKDMNKIGASLL